MKPDGVLLRNTSLTLVINALCFIRHRLWEKKKLLEAGSRVEEKSSQRDGDSVGARGHYLNAWMKRKGVLENTM